MIQCILSSCQKAVTVVAKECGMRYYTDWREKRGFTALLATAYVYVVHPHSARVGIAVDSSPARE